MEDEEFKNSERGRLLDASGFEGAGKDGVVIEGDWDQKVLFL